MKIALIPGHTKTSGGAINYKGENEYNWASRVLKLTQKYIKCESIIITRDSGGIEGAVRKAKELGCVATFELHFNWAEGDPNQDIEVLCSSKTPKSIKWARSIAADLNAAYDSFGLRHGDGAFIDPSRGGNNVLQGYLNKIEYCVLVEPQFGNLNNSDSRQIFEDDEKLAKVFGESISKFFIAQGLITTSENPPVTSPEVPEAKPTTGVWDPTIFFNKVKSYLKDPTQEKLEDLRNIWPKAEDKITALIHSNTPVVIDNSELGIAISKVVNMMISPLKVISQGEMKPIDNWKPIVKTMEDAVAQGMFNLIKPATSTSKIATMDGLVKAYKNYKIEFEALKEVTLGQFTLETGRVTTDLAKLHFNFGGVKFRSDVPNCPKGATILKGYVASDGPNDYFQCDSYETFFELYWKFLERSPYKGWRQFGNDPEGFIKFIAKAGYCPRALYAEDVIKLIPEAKERLAKA